MKPGQRGSADMLRSAVVRVLTLTLEQAAEDPAWRGGPAEYDYLSARQIAEVIGLDSNWRTMQYETPSPTRVLRQLRRLEHDDRVWTWEAGTRQVPAATRFRWALIPDALLRQPSAR